RRDVPVAVRLRRSGWKGREHGGALRRAIGRKGLIMVKKAEMEGKALTTEAAPKGVAAKGARTKAGRERAASKARKPVKRREAPSVGDVREGPAALGLATSLAKRMRGLLLSRPDEGALLLLPCADVHTVGMGRRIDVAFVDGTGCVLAAYRNV